MANALLVTDMLVGFLEPGHNLDCGDDARGIIPSVQRLIEREQARGSSVFFICDTHDPDDLEFQMFPEHCVRSIKECEVIPELSAYDGEIISKRRYNAFFDTDLEGRLADLDPEKVIICGLCTDICVFHTAASARDRDYVVEIPVDCVASFDADAHESALSHLKKILGAKLVHTPAPVTSRSSYR